MMLYVKTRTQDKGEYTIVCSSPKGANYISREMFVIIIFFKLYVF